MIYVFGIDMCIEGLFPHPGGYSMDLWKINMMMMMMMMMMILHSPYRVIHKTFET
jgi:hypothetical protein